MSRRLIGATLLLTAFFLLPVVDAYAQKKKAANPQPNAGGPIDSNKLRAGTFVGVLKSIPGSDRMFTLAFEIQQVAGGGGLGGRAGAGANPNAYRMQQIMVQMQQAQRMMAMARTPQQRTQAQQQMMRIQQQMLQMQRGNVGRPGGGAAPRIQTVTRDVEFQVSESVKVRTMLLPEAFDDKGNIKKFSPKELAELKGKDRNLPGYESSMEKLEAGQRVQVTLAAVGPAAKAGKAKDDDAGVAADKRMQVRMIVIIQEGQGTPMAKGRAAKKK